MFATLILNTLHVLPGSDCSYTDLRKRSWHSASQFLSSTPR